MLLRARLSYHRCRRYNSTQHSARVSLSDAQLTETKSDDDFLPWLRRKSGAEISTALSIGKSSHGRALFASRSIEAGECVLKCPYSVVVELFISSIFEFRLWIFDYELFLCVLQQLSPDNLAPELRDSIGDRVGDMAKLAVVVLCEQKLEKESEWEPYISRLPRYEEMHNTIFWSDDELEMIRRSSLYQETINHRLFVLKEYEAIRRALAGFPEMYESITCEDFMCAYALVTSRAWGSKKGYSLIPFADFLNHDGTSEAVVLSDDHRDFSEVIADRNYAQGEQMACM